MRGTASDTDVAYRLVGIEFSCGAGASDPGCKFRPAHFRTEWERLKPSSHAGGLSLVWRSIAGVNGREADPQNFVGQATQRLAETTLQAVQEGDRFVVIGGIPVERELTDDRIQCARV